MKLHIDIYGRMSYRVHGNAHRLDGPSVIYPDGYVQYWIYDTQYETELEYWIAVQQYYNNCEFARYNIIKLYMCIDTIGNITYKLNNLKHNNNGPAAITIDGDTTWWINGIRHRVDGPAIEFSDGRKFWYVNGVRHRLDGPAYESANGNKEWCINDRRYNNEFEYWLAVQNYASLHI